jgi:hypothetical protein
MPAQIACAWPQSLGRDHIVRGSIARLGTKTRACAVRAAAAAAVVFVLAAASGAVAQTAIDVPAQSFDQGQARSSKPVIKWRPDDSSWERERNDGPSFRVNVPLGAGAWAPVTVRFEPAEVQATDVDDTDAAAELDDDFIRDAEAQDDDFARNAAAR